MTKSGDDTYRYSDEFRSQLQRQLLARQSLACRSLFLERCFTPKHQTLMLFYPFYPGDSVSLSHRRLFFFLCFICWLTHTSAVCLIMLAIISLPSCMMIHANADRTFHVTRGLLLRLTLLKKVGEILCEVHVRSGVEASGRWLGLGGERGFWLVCLTLRSIQLFVDLLVTETWLYPQHPWLHRPRCVSGGAIFQSNMKFFHRKWGVLLKNRLSIKHSVHVQVQKLKCRIK